MEGLGVLRQEAIFSNLQTNLAYEENLESCM